MFQEFRISLLMTLQILLTNIACFKKIPRKWNEHNTTSTEPQKKIGCFALNPGCLMKGSFMVYENNPNKRMILVYPPVPQVHTFAKIKVYAFFPTKKCLFHTPGGGDWHPGLMAGSSIALAAAVSKAHSVDSEFDAASAKDKGKICKHGYLGHACNSQYC